MLGPLAVIAAAAVATQANPVELFPAQARAMSPQALAAILLPPGHEASTAAIVHPTPQEFSAVVPWIYAIDLVGAGRPAVDQGFCAIRIYAVQFKPPQDASIVSSKPYPARSAATSVKTRYRFQDAASSCAADVETSFPVTREDRANQVSWVRQLAQVRSQARQGHPLGFPVQFQDRIADDTERYAVENPTAPPLPLVGQRIADAEHALAALPLSSISNVDVDARPSAEDRLSEGQRLVSVWMSSFEVSVTVDGDRIVRMRILHAYPPPF